MLVCCAPLGRLQGKSYRVTAKLDLEGMHVSRGVRNSSNPNSAAYRSSFCVCGLQKTMEFQARWAGEDLKDQNWFLLNSNEEEKEKWLSALDSAIEEFKERKSTFKSKVVKEENISPTSPQTPQSLDMNDILLSYRGISTPELVSEAELGIRAPRWIKDHEVTMCMGCSKPFHKIIRRRHHCRACGRVCWSYGCRFFDDICFLNLGGLFWVLWTQSNVTIRSY